MDYTPNDRQLAQASITWRPSDRTDITAIGIYQHDKNPPNYNIVPLVASLYARPGERIPDSRFRSEEHTSELQSLMRISYAVFCLKKKQTKTQKNKRFTSTNYL